MQDYSRFFKIYANIPHSLRDGIIVVVNGKTYSWNTAYDEMQNETELGKIIFDKLVKMELI